MNQVDRVGELTQVDFCAECGLRIYGREFPVYGGGTELRWTHRYQGYWGERVPKDGEHQAVPA